MDKVIEQLLVLESEAKEAMNAIAKEDTRIADKAREDLQRRIAEIEQQGIDTIKRLEEESERHFLAKIRGVQENYRVKEDELRRRYAMKKEDMLDRIMRDVLYGES